MSATALRPTLSFFTFAFLPTSPLEVPPVPISDSDLATAIETMPPVVSVLRRLLAVLRDPNSDVEDAARLVRADTVLAAQILRLANSPHYALTHGVGSVEEAIQWVGLTEMTRMIATLSGREAFSRELVYYRVPASLLWQHTLAVAVAAEQVAIRFLMDRDAAYLGGLLHTIGLWAIDRIAVGRGLPPREGDQPMRDWERENFGEENPAIAARVLAAWNLPESIVSAMALRYRVPEREMMGELGSALFIACALAERVPAGLPVERGIFALTPEQVSAIGLGRGGLADLEFSSVQLLTRVRSMLNMA